MSDLSEFQPYLESVRATYEKWWQLYTLTDAAGKQRQAQQGSPPFDFGLVVQTVKKDELRNEEKRREEGKIERFPVLDGIRKYAEQHVLLVGRPGSGKSTALARLMLEEATNPRSRLPVLVELRYWQGSIEQLSRDSFTRHGLPAELVDEALKRSLLLFDGVNELPSEEARSQLSAFRRNHPKLPMIFTTRDLSLGGDLGIEKKLEMQPLTEAQMQVFIRAYVPEQAEQMLRQLKDRLREFGQSPLLLWMLCGLFQQTGTIPENLGLVFREFTRGYERYLKEDVRIESDRAWWKPVLQQLAWIMMQGEKPTEFRVAIRYEEAVGAIAQFLKEKVPYAEDFARKCLRDLQKHHLIQVGTNREELEFRHQLFQEYYAAEALLEQLPYLTENELKQNYLNYLKWKESIGLMLAIVESDAQALQVVRLALAVDLSLGAQLAGKVQQGLQGKTVELIREQLLPDWLQAKMLGETRSEQVSQSLVDLASDPASVARVEAITSLGSIEHNSTDITPFLIQMINDKDPVLSFIAAASLKNLRPETFEKYFENDEENPIYKLTCAVANPSTQITSPGLITAWHKESIRKKIKDAFDKLMSENLSDKLQAIDDPYLALGIVQSLANQRPEKAIPLLLRLLSDKEPEIRGEVVSILKSVKDDCIVPMISDLLKLLNTKFGKEAFQAIQAIQVNCQFYNYEIYQAHLEAQKRDRQKSQDSDRSPTIINNYPNATKIRQTIMSNSSKYNFPNAQKVQIFEQVNTYIENNHPTDPEVKTAIADLTLLLTQLQTQYPQVKTESQALTVLDAEFTEIQQSTTHPLVNLRQQLLNPERHLQAIKATLAEIAKHYLEESVWAKAAITYLDKLSETPDQGA